MYALMMISTYLCFIKYLVSVIRIIHGMRHTYNVKLQQKVATDMFSLFSYLHFIQFPT